jgi:hypothetical protein
MALAAWIFHLTQFLPTVPQGIGPGDYPRVAAAGLFVLGGLLVVEALRRLGVRRQVLFTGRGLLRILALAVVTYAYILAMPALGFLLTSPVFLFSAMLLFRVEKKRVAALVSVVLSVAVDLVFYHGFQVVLPRFSLW